MLFNLLHIETINDEKVCYFSLEELLKTLNNIFIYEDFHLSDIIDRLLYNNNINGKLSFLEEVKIILDKNKKEGIEFLKIINNTDIILPSDVLISKFFEKFFLEDKQTFFKIITFLEKIGKEINLWEIYKYIVIDRNDFGFIEDIDNNTIMAFTNSSNFDKNMELSKLIKNLIDYHLLVNKKDFSYEKLSKLNYSGITKANIKRIFQLKPNFNFEKIEPQDRNLKSILNKIENYINEGENLNTDEIYEYIKFGELKYLETDNNFLREIIYSRKEPEFVPSYEKVKAYKEDNLEEYNKKFVMYNIKKVLLFKKVVTFFENNRNIDYIYKNIKQDLEDFTREDKFDILNKIKSFYYRKKEIEKIGNLTTDEEINNFMYNIYGKKIVLDSNRGKQLEFEIRGGAIIFKILYKDDYYYIENDTSYNENNSGGFKSNFIEDRYNILNGSLVFINGNDEDTIIHEKIHTDNDILFRRYFLEYDRISNKIKIFYTRFDNPRIILKDELIAYSGIYDNNGYSSLVKDNGFYTYGLNGKRWEYHKKNLKKNNEYLNEIKREFPENFIFLISVFNIWDWYKIVEYKEIIKKIFTK